MALRLLTEHHSEFVSLKGDCTGSSESTLDKCHIVGNHMSMIIIIFYNFKSMVGLLGQIWCAINYA